MDLGSARDLMALLTTRRISSVEILRALIDRVEAWDGAINSIICRDFERALAAARRADDVRARSASFALPSLFGLPMTVKESFDVAGLPTTWGATAYAGRRAMRDAEAVARLREAGAIIFGKTNVPEGLADYQTYNRLHGRTNNPWNTALTCGGSSGGSAAALAAGFTPAELGSDLAGSLRAPAHFCGVFSHKPSYGLVSEVGHSIDDDDARADLICIGPMARAAEDLGLLFEALVGPRAADAHAWRCELPKSRHDSLADYRVAVLPDHPACRIDHRIRAALDQLADALRRQGALVDSQPEWPIDLELCGRDYLMLVRAVGSRRAAPDLLAGLAAEASSLDDDDWSYRAACRRAAALSHHAWLTLNGRRAANQRAWRSFFANYDIVLCPAHPSLAFPHDTQAPRESRMLRIDGSEQDYNSYLFWMAIAGASYLPCTTRPLALIDGLPAGVQIIGPHLEDKTTLRFAELLDGLCPQPRCQMGTRDVGDMVFPGAPLDVADADRSCETPRAPAEGKLKEEEAEC